jgi:hypothetical protein
MVGGWTDHFHPFFVEKQGGTEFGMKYCRESKLEAAQEETKEKGRFS